MDSQFLSPLFWIAVCFGAVAIMCWLSTDDDDWNDPIGRA